MVSRLLTHSWTEFDEKLPHELEVGHGETEAKFLCLRGRQFFEHLLPIRGPFRSLLLMRAVDLICRNALASGFKPQTVG